MVRICTHRVFENDSDPVTNFKLLFVCTDLSQIMPKLQLLSINFPKLRIVWSPGAHYTSEVFHVSSATKSGTSASWLALWLINCCLLFTGIEAWEAATRSRSGPSYSEGLRRMLHINEHKPRLTWIPVQVTWSGLPQYLCFNSQMWFVRSTMYPFWNWVSDHFGEPAKCGHFALWNSYGT